MFYSILPIFVACYFSIVCAITWNTSNRKAVHKTFSLLCLSTFVWQLSWAILFQTDNLDIARLIVKIGYTSIIFLPTFLYHFLSEVTKRKEEYRYICASYFLCCILSGFLIFTNYFVQGVYQYAWGFYPRAGLFHSIHMLQTVTVVMRGLYITFLSYKKCDELNEKKRLKYFILAIFIYFLAAADYACNYGFKFYPIGAVFLTISMSIMAYAILKEDALDTKITISKVFASVLIYILIGFITVGIYVAPISWIFSLPLLVFSSIIFTAYGDSIKVSLQTSIQRKWMRKNYDEKDFILSITKALSNAFTIKEIINNLSEAIAEILQPKKIFIIKKQNKSKNVFCLYDSETQKMSDLNQDNELTQYFLIEEKEAAYGRLLSNEISENSELFDATSIIIPFYSLFGLEFIFILDKKDSEKAYDNRDLYLLNMTKEQARVALDKARERIEIIRDLANPNLDDSDVNEPEHTSFDQVMSELKKTREQLLQSEKNSAIGTLSAGLLHEINNPLAYVITSAFNAKRSQDIEEAKVHIELVEKGAKRINLLIKKLNTFIYPEKVNDQKEFHIIEVIEDAVEFASLEYKSVEIEKEIDESIIVIGSKSHLIQVLINVMINSFKSLREANIEEPKLKISTCKTDEMVTVDIEDNGPGISKKNLTKVFDPFFTTREIGSGTGMGLSICKKIIEAHGGSCKLESEEGLWTKFSFSLNSRKI